MPTVYVAREREETAIPIAELMKAGRLDIYPEVQAREYFDIRFRGDQLIVTAGKFIGVVPLNERVLIQVEPKIPLGNLLTLISSAGGALTAINLLDVAYMSAPALPVDVLRAIASAFVRELERVDRDGLTQAYVERDEQTSHLRGRVRFGDSIRGVWSRGVRHLADLRFFELTRDVPENRAIAHAVQVLLAHDRNVGLPVAAAALARFADAFDAMQIRPDPSLLEGPYDERKLSPAYTRALRLAALVSAGRGVELPSRGGGIRLPSFIVNMESLFERYIRSLLARRLPAHRVLDGNGVGAKPLFDDRPAPAANPDIIVRSGPPSPPIVLEVKYKPAETRADINQVLTYALSYESPQVLLVLPCDSGAVQGLSHIGTIRGVTVSRYSFDLAAPDLSAAEAAFADAVRARVPPGQ